MKKALAIIAATLVLAACQAPKPVTRVQLVPTECPPVQECTIPLAKFTTLGELTQSYVNLENAFMQCKLARDTLQQCVDTSHKLATEQNEQQKAQ